MKRHSKKTSRKENRDSNTIILVDASSLTYAAFHAMGHLRYDGQRTGVIFGFLSRMLQMAVKFNTNKFITCWDSRTDEGLRIKDYPDYKKKRFDKRNDMSELEKKERQSLLEQTALLAGFILPQMGFRNIFIQKGWEADDLIGYWVNKLKKKKVNLIVVTTDADMYQCLNYCKIYSPTKKKFFTKKDLQSKYGISPEQWPMAKAIGGCQGDNVIGIQGASDPKNPKSKSLKYLRGELKKGVIFDRIESKEGKKIIERNLPLVTVPYRPDIIQPMIIRRNVYNRKRFIKVFGQYNFKSFLEEKKFNEWERAFL